MDSALEHLVSRDPEILGGTLVFTGTRVPVKNLIDYLEKGFSLDEFLDDFPTVDRVRAQRVVALLGERLIAAEESLAA